MKFIIPGELPSLNEYILAERTNRYAAAKIKKEAQNLVSIFAKRDLKGWKASSPVFIRYLWVMKNKRKDKDNIAFAHKFIQDALVEAGFLPDDGWDEIAGFTDSFTVDKLNPRIEVTIEEVTDD